MNKTAARKKFLSLRNAMTEEERKEASGRIERFLTGSDIYKNADTVLVYVSFGSEVDTSGIIGYSLNAGKTVAVPYCSGKDMEFRIITSADDLEKGMYGIYTAGENCPAVTDFENALCVLPAVSVDAAGNRLGYGAGYYDRFLSSRPVTAKIALCFEKCLADALPNENHDVRIDTVITDGGVLYVRNG